MAVIGFFAVVAAVVAYFSWIFAFKRFSYKTWIFDLVAGAGMMLAAVSWMRAGGTWLVWGSILLGIIWFIVSRAELRLRGSKELKLRAGDPVPALALLRTNGMQFTERDLVANVPALLTFYRGWWCPTSKAQLQGILDQYDDLTKGGITIYAASVDEPEQAQAIQEYVGDRITILCGVPEALLERIGVVDKRGAPWYDRLLYRAPAGHIAMPTTLVIDKNGRVIMVSRATRLDYRPGRDAVLASLSLAA